jgi:hypothetical protein
MALELDAIAMSSASLALYIYGDEPDFGRRKDYALEFMLKLHSLTNGMAGVDTTIEMPNSYMDAAAINVGLHSLTGQSHKTEKSNRKDRLLTTGVDDPAFGLAIHAFGDAFAHRNDATGAMYRPLQGHMLAGHDPDCTSRHMPAYQTYINELWDVLWKKRSAFFLDADVVSPVRDTPNKSALLYSGVHQFLLSEMTKEDPKEPEKEATQIKDITSYILTNYGIMISFPPDYDGIPFKGIRRDILARIGKATPLSKYKEIAKDWAAQSGGLPLAQKELTFAPLFKELTQALTKTVAPRVLKATMPGAYYIGKWLAIIE